MVASGAQWATLSRARSTFFLHVVPTKVSYGLSAGNTFFPFRVLSGSLSPNLFTNVLQIFITLSLFIKYNLTAWAVNFLFCFFVFVYLSQSQISTKTDTTKKNAVNLFTAKASSSLGVGQIGTSCQVLRTGYAISSQSAMNHGSSRHSLRSGRANKVILQVMGVAINSEYIKT